MFLTDVIMSGLPPHIAQIIAGHRDINVTLGYTKARELHQAGEKSQAREVGAVSSRDFRGFSIRLPDQAICQVGPI